MTVHVPFRLFWSIVIVFCSIPTKLISLCSSTQCWQSTISLYVCLSRIVIRYSWVVLSTSKCLWRRRVIFPLLPFRFRSRSMTRDRWALHIPVFGVFCWWIFTSISWPDLAAFASCIGYSLHLWGGLTLTLVIFWFFKCQLCTVQFAPRIVIPFISLPLVIQIISPHLLVIRYLMIFELSVIRTRFFAIWLDFRFQKLRLSYLERQSQSIWTISCHLQIFVETRWT